MIEQRYQFKNVTIDHINPDFDRAYLEFYGLNHLRPSYVAWIFFREKLPKRVSPRNKGFAGTLAVFGHSQCWGSEGHCHGDDGIRRFDSRPSHPMTPAFKRVPVAQALKEHLIAGKSRINICIYAYSRFDWPDRRKRSLLACEGLQLVTR